MRYHLGPLCRSHLPAATELLRESCDFDCAHRVADEKLFEEGANKLAADSWGAFSEQQGTSDSTLLGVVTRSGRWIRLLAIAPNARRQGIGSALLSHAEGRMPAKSVPRIMDQPGNYLSPGIDAENQAAITWLKKSGYREIGENLNLLIDLHDNPLVHRSLLVERVREAATQGYSTRLATHTDNEWGAQIESHFSAAWASSYVRALQKAARKPPSRVHLAFRGPELAGFAVCDGNNRGLASFGPTGTFGDHRGRGIGALLLLACCVDLQEAGYQRCEVEWIGPRAFYEKIVGVMGHRRFVTMEKPILAQPTPTQPLPTKARS